MKNSNNPIIAAIDNIPPKDILKECQTTYKDISYVKIGLEVFNLLGKNFLMKFEQSIKRPYFLDLKLHDIPNTVFSAIKSLSGLNPKFLTIHLSGGKEMIHSAMEAKSKYLPETKIIGVTYLTSLGEEDFQTIYGQESKILLEKIISSSKSSGIDGIVCSGADLPIATKIDPNKELIKITPGIRP